MAGPLHVLVALTRAYAALRRSRRETVTLDQVRSDLSHESSAKLARLQGLIEDWRRGRREAADVADATALLRDLERIQSRHARLAAADLRTFARLVRLLALLAEARATLPHLGTPPRPEAVERFARLTETLRARAREQVEAISARYGARVATLAGDAVEAVRAESGHGTPEGVGIELQASADASAHWVPRREAERWADLLRNIVRNAVQATDDRRLASGEPTAPVEPVRVRVEPLRHRSGVAMEVEDAGVGMDAERIASMWHAGRSSHGAHRGEGLTEGKRAFLRERGELEVRSVVGRGTCMRVEVPHRDVPVRLAPMIALPAVALPLLALLAIGLVEFTPFFAPDIVRVDVQDEHAVRAWNSQGHVEWTKPFDEKVNDNWLTNIHMPRAHQLASNHPELIRGRHRWETAVFFATQPPQGTGHLVRLDVHGNVVWKRTLEWHAPAGDTANAGAGLECSFVTSMSWPGRSEKVLVLNVRRHNLSSTSIQFWTLEGRRIASYEHPGQLEFVEATDANGDGRDELVLSGYNNRAHIVNDSLTTEETHKRNYLSCLVVLRPPEVSGQAWPGITWKNEPKATEAAYMIVPPLLPDSAEAIQTVSFEPHAAVLVLADGRRYVLDPEMKPVRCDAGDFTKADSLAPIWPAGPLVYFRSGRPEYLKLPVGGTPPKSPS